MDAGRKRELAADVLAALPAIRSVCKRLPSSTESLTYGNPSFKRGRKTFVVLDRYQGQSCLWILVDPQHRSDKLKVDGWFASPYDPRRKALCCVLERVDWTSIGDDIAASYHLTED